jgi:hypothetical protein
MLAMAVVAVGMAFMVPPVELRQAGPAAAK